MMYLTKTGCISNSAIVLYWSHKELNIWRKHTILIMEIAHRFTFKNICLSHCLARTTENTLKQLRHWHTKRTKVCFYDSPTSNGKSLWTKWPLIFMSALEEKAIKSISPPLFILPFTACGLSQPSKSTWLIPARSHISKLMMPKSDQGDQKFFPSLGILIWNFSALNRMLFSYSPFPCSARQVCRFWGSAKLHSGEQNSSEIPIALRVCKCKWLHRQSEIKGILVHVTCTDKSSNSYWLSSPLGTSLDCGPKWENDDLWLHFHLASTFCT